MNIIYGTAVSSAPWFIYWTCSQTPSCNVISLARIFISMMIQMADWPNTTPIDEKTLSFKVLLYLVLKLKICSVRTYLRMKDILWLCENVLWCVPSRWVKNVCFLLAITASQWRIVLFSPYFFDLVIYFFFIFPGCHAFEIRPQVVISLFDKINRQAK